MTEFDNRFSAALDGRSQDELRTLWERADRGAQEVEIDGEIIPQGVIAEAIQLEPQEEKGPTLISPNGTRVYKSDDPMEVIYGLVGAMLLDQSEE